jgi:hypothetical protein
VELEPPLTAALGFDISMVELPNCQADSAIMADRAIQPPESTVLSSR